MAANAEFVTAPKNHFSAITNADGTAFKSSWTTAAVKGGLIRGIVFTTDNSADLSIGIYIQRAGVDYLQCVVTVPIGAGNSAGVGAVNALDPQWMPHLDSEPNRALHLEPGDVLRYKPGAAVVATKFLHCSVYGGTY